MADLMNFSITPLGPGAVQTIRATIEGKVLDSETQAVLFDFTGANAIAFPAALRDLTQSQQDSITAMVAQKVLLAKAGLWDG